LKRSRGDLAHWGRKRHPFWAKRTSANVNREKKGVGRVRSLARERLGGEDRMVRPEKEEELTLMRREKRGEK